MTLFEPWIVIICSLNFTCSIELNLEAHIMTTPSVNKTILIGNLGKDPETHYLPSGKAVTNFSLATNEHWSDSNTGDKQQKTEWHNIVAFARLAEVTAEYLRKGSKVYIEGRNQTSKREKDGHTFYKHEVVIKEIQFLDSKPTAKPESNNKLPPAATNTDNDFDDDIPF